MQGASQPRGIMYTKLKWILLFIIEAAYCEIMESDEGNVIKAILTNYTKEVFTNPIK